jgi:hypothetical protein
MAPLSDGRCRALTSDPLLVRPDAGRAFLAPPGAWLSGGWHPAKPRPEGRYACGFDRISGYLGTMRRFVPLSLRLVRSMSDKPEPKAKPQPEPESKPKLEPKEPEENFLQNVRLWQRLVAGGSVALVVLAAWQEWWPFREEPTSARSYKDPSSWQLVFSDRVMLGFVRLGIVALVIYLVVSVPALIVAGRWLRGFGTGGVSTDAAEEASKTLEQYEAGTDALTRQLDTANAELDKVRNQRNEAQAIVTRLVKSQTSSQTKSD